MYPKPTADTTAVLCLGSRNQTATLHCRDSKPSIGLWISFEYKIIERRNDPGTWKIKTLGYKYTLLEIDDREVHREIVSWQWHSGHPAHIHFAGRYRPIHFETGRVYLEQVLRTAITEFGVCALDEDWQNILAQRQENVERHRSRPW
jgi:hypothetical protein